MRRELSRRPVFCFSVAAPLLVASLAAHAGNVAFRKAYDVRQTPSGIVLAPSQQIGMPGGLENAPAYDGRYVIFPLTVVGAAPFASHLWSYDTQTGTLFRLVDDDDLYPGTGSALKGYATGYGFAPFNVDAGRVAFSGRTITPLGELYGFLGKAAHDAAVPNILVDTSTPVPDAQGYTGNFHRFTFAASALIAQDDGLLVFSQDNSVGDGGSYRVRNTGGRVTEIVDDLPLGTVFAPECCDAWDFNRHRLVADTFNVFGTGPIVTIKDNRTELQTIVSAERGDKVPNDPEHRVFDAFRLQAPQIENRSVVFQGAATPHIAGSTRDLAGIYSFIYSAGLPRAPSTPDSLPPYAPGRIIRLVDSNTAVPGGTGNFTRDDPLQGTLGGGGFSFSGSSVFFLGKDQAGKQGLYHVSFRGGAITKIVASGDTLPDGRIVAGVNGSLSNQPSLQVDGAENDEVAVKLTVRTSAAGSTPFDAVYILGSQGLPASPVMCDGQRATILGTSGDNTIYGTPARDVIAGLEGNDTIYGLGGNDIICGGDGNDTLHGGAQTDVLIGGSGEDTCATGETTTSCEVLP